MYRVLRALWVRPGVVLALDYLDEEELARLVEKGIVEPVETDNEDQEVDDGD